MSERTSGPPWRRARARPKRCRRCGRSPRALMDAGAHAAARGRHGRGEHRRFGRRERPAAGRPGGPRNLDGRLHRAARPAVGFDGAPAARRAGPPAALMGRVHGVGRPGTLRRAAAARRAALDLGCSRSAATFGPYRLEAVLGRGGMGMVFEATQLSLDRVVALKVVAPGLSADQVFRARFRREGPMQARIDHPHVVPVYEAGEHQGHLFIAMRLVRGSNLKELDRPRASSTRAARWRSCATSPTRSPPRTSPRTSSLGREALEHPRGLPRPRLPVRLRAREGARLGNGELHEDGPRRRHARLHRARADPRAGREPRQRRLRLRRRAPTRCSTTGQVPFPRSTDAALLYAHVSEPPPLLSVLRPDLPMALDEVIAHGLAKGAWRPPGHAAGNRRGGGADPGRHAGRRAAAAG